MAVNVGQGAILQATISSTLTPIFQLLEGEGPEFTVPSKDKTNLADVARRYRAGLPDGGKLTWTVQYDPADATHQWVLAQIIIWPQQLVAWKLIVNTATGTAGWNFNAFLTKFAVKGMNQEDNLEADMELQVDGLPVTHT